MPLFDRRSFLKNSLMSSIVAVGGITWPSWMPRVVFGPPDRSPRGDTLVAIFLRGAHDGLNIVVPYTEGEYHAKRTRIGLDEPNKGTAKSVVDLDGQFGLNPVLGPLKDIWDEGDLAVVHAVGSPDPTHSHFDAMDYMERGTPGEKQLQTGWLARHLASLASENHSPFRAVGMGSVVQAALRGPVPALALESIASFHLDPNRRASDVTRFQQTIASLYQGTGFVEVQGTATFEALDIIKKIEAGGAYAPANGAQYPNTPFGNQLKTIAQLIKADVGLEVACVDKGGWDTHAGEGDVTPAGNNLPALLNDLQAGLRAFYTDLQDRMDNVIVVTMSEFGRRLADNASGGTDHGHGNVMFLMGGGVVGGRVHGVWPGLAPNQLYGPGDLAITTDFRDVLGEILLKRVGNPHLDQVFPNYTQYHYRGVVTPRRARTASLTDLLAAAR